MIIKIISFFTLIYLLVCLPIDAVEHSTPEFSVLTQERCLTSNCKTSFKKLKRFAKFGSTEAQVVIATAYLTGNGLEKNLKKAVVNLKKAKRAGSARAAWTLSYLYMEGIGVSKNVEQANELLQYAIDKNFGPALFQKAIETLNLTKMDNDESIALLKRAISTSNKDAIYLLAQMYEFGEGVEKNNEQAVLLYSQLKFSGYKDSEIRLRGLIDEHIVDSKLSSIDQKSEPNTEIITVSGTKWDLQKTLTTLVEHIDSTGLYDGKGIGHLRGRGCMNSSSACASIKSKKEIGQLLGVFR